MNIMHFDWNGTARRQASLRTAISDGPEDEGLPERNPREVIGGNNPPAEIDDSPLGFAKTAQGLFEKFMNDTPVIADGADAVAAKVHVETARGALAALETERDGKVRPLNQKVREINATYSAVTGPFTRLLDELKARLTTFAKAEERRREAIAAEARKAAQKLIDEAAEIERREIEARDNAAAGEADVGLAEKIVATDDAIRAAKLGIRQANVAERDTTVRVGGGGQGRKALGMRTVTTLTLDDALIAVHEMGVSEKTRDSILSDARAFKKLNGRWPSGVTATEDREF